MGSAPSIERGLHLVLAFFLRLGLRAASSTAGPGRREIAERSGVDFSRWSGDTCCRESALAQDLRLGEWNWSHTSVGRNREARRFSSIEKYSKQMPGQ